MERKKKSSWYLKIVNDKLVLGAHKLDAVHVDGEQRLGGMGPQPLVHDGEEGAAVERELLDARQVPHLGLQLRLVGPVVLKYQHHQYTVFPVW